MPFVGARVRMLAGAVIALAGVVWLGQGLGVIPGSFMTGDPFWAAAGAGAVVVGGALAWSGRGRSSGSTDQ
jgi:hypothetical protein